MDESHILDDTGAADRLGARHMSVERRTDLLLACSGIAFVGMFFVGLALIAGFVPPPSPSRSAASIASIYRRHTESIRIGLAFVFVGTIFLLTFGSAVSSQTRRIATASRSLIHLQVASVAAASLIILVPVILWWTAAFRATGDSAQTIRLLDDIGWITFVGGFVPFVTWAVGIGLTILSDTSPTPVFPRWSGYISLLAAFVQIPPILLVFVKSGPFAWNGLYSWWLVAFDFFAWIVVMIVLTIRAALREAARAGA
jgi:hypothetical protein